MLINPGGEFGFWQGFAYFVIVICGILSAQRMGYNARVHGFYYRPPRNTVTVPLPLLDALFVIACTLIVLACAFYILISLRNLNYLLPIPFGYLIIYRVTYAIEFNRKDTLHYWYKNKK